MYNSSQSGLSFVKKENTENEEGSAILESPSTKRPSFFKKNIEDGMDR